MTHIRSRIRSSKGEWQLLRVFRNTPVLKEVSSRRQICKTRWKGMSTIREDIQSSHQTTKVLSKKVLKQSCPIRTIIKESILAHQDHHSRMSTSKLQPRLMQCPWRQILMSTMMCKISRNLISIWSMKLLAWSIWLKLKSKSKLFIGNHRWTQVMHPWLELKNLE
jgi:hypothetical protein